MSAPLQDPIAVNTKDDRCWVRRASASDGHGLYALEGSPEGPEQRLFLIRELAEFGLRSMAYAVPMPVGDGVPADAITQRIAPTQALARVDHSLWEDPHDSPLHHPYTVSHDLELPESGGQR